MVEALLSKYAVDRNPYSEDGVGVPCVFHYTHLQSAHEAIVKGHLPSRRHTIGAEAFEGVWLAPTDYIAGSRFGGIGFVLPSGPILDDADVFYVGLNPHSAGLRFRFLVVPHGSSCEPFGRRVDPTGERTPLARLPDGSWRVKKARDISVEFAYPRTVSLEECKTIVVTNHGTSEDNCCITKLCPDAGVGTIGARLLAHLLTGRHVEVAAARLAPSFVVDPLSDLCTFVIADAAADGVAFTASDVEQHIIRALAAYGSGDDHAAHELFGMVPRSVRIAQLEALFVARGLTCYVEYVRHYCRGE